MVHRDRLSNRGGQPAVGAVPRSRLGYYYLCAFVVAAVLLGGGTQKGLWTVFALELAVLPLWFMAFSKAGERLARLPLFLFGLVGVLFAIQLVPIGAEILVAGVGPEWGLGRYGLSTDVGRTLDSAIVFATLAVVFLAASRLSTADHHRMVALILLAALLQGLMALIQFSSSRPLPVDILPYSPTAGTFANRNHFAALLFIAVPLLIWQMELIGRRRLVFALLPLILILQFAGGSGAGVGITVVLSFIAYLILATKTARGRWLAGGLVLVGSVALVFAWGRLIGEVSDSPIDRLVIAQTTLKAIGAYFPLGSGFGSFVHIYPQFAEASQIVSRFINHAHNEYLELALEGGWPAIGAVLIYFGLLVANLPAALGSKLKMAALLAIIFVLVHSGVDYPLRTMAIGVVFAVLNGIYFSTAPARKHRRTRE
ncbi:MAG: O-antigen ligase family protein [Alphaproteobacteria bacterium]|nr:O-antigen ligase family protein [Alphaproteobacteria bacterium]